MMLIDINGLLPKDLDLAMITRDASFAPPTPETYDSGDATAQAAKNSTDCHTPPPPLTLAGYGRAGYG